MLIFVALSGGLAAAGCNTLQCPAIGGTGLLDSADYSEGTRVTAYQHFVGGDVDEVSGPASFRKVNGAPGTRCRCGGKKAIGAKGSG